MNSGPALRHRAILGNRRDDARVGRQDFGTGGQDAPSARTSSTVTRPCPYHTADRTGGCHRRRPAFGCAKDITMAMKMLIDATHAEETRVVVVDGNKVEEFDFETANQRQIAGNIYLAKITRVEPSLQAAFVDYGGNRHGFLAFSEIHPDYYRYPRCRPRGAEGRGTRRGRGPGGRGPRSVAVRAASPAPRRTRRPTRRLTDDAGQDASDRMTRSIHGRRQGTSTRSRGHPPRPAQAARPPLQDPGSHQGPPDHAGAGRQGRARQQGRGADHLPVAGRPLLRADAQHRARRRHLPQDHQCRRPQEAQGNRGRT